MTDVFVVQNQHGMFANKHREWVDGRDPKLLFRTQHKDEAINLVFELSSKDIYLRASAVAAELDHNRQPVVEVTAPAAEPEDLALSSQPVDDNDNNSIDSTQDNNGSEQNTIVDDSTTACDKNHETVTSEQNTGANPLEAPTTEQQQNEVTPEPVTS